MRAIVIRGNGVGSIFTLDRRGIGQQMNEQSGRTIHRLRRIVMEENVLPFSVGTIIIKQNQFNSINKGIYIKFTCAYQ